MLTEKSPTQNVSPTPVSLDLNALFGKAIAEFNSNRLQTLMRKIAPVGPMPRSEPIQIPAQQQVESDPYSESDYQWLVEVLDVLSDMASRNVNDDFAALTETDYAKFDGVLKELIYVVGDDEKHPLAPLMDFIGVLTTKYEDKHFPKLTDLFPELVEDVNPNDTKNKNQQDNPTKEEEKPVNLLAAEAFYSVGGLLLEGNKRERAIFAYDQAIYLNPEYTYAYFMRGLARIGLECYESAIDDFDKGLQLEPNNAYAYFMRSYPKVELEKYESALTDCDEAIRLNPSLAEAYGVRGEVKVLMGETQKAKADYQKALELAEQTDNQDLKTEIEQSLRELNNTE